MLRREVTKMNAMLKIILIFLIAQLLGIYCGYVLFLDMTANPYVSSFVISTNSEDVLNVFWLGTYIIIGAALMFLFIKFRPHNMFFVIMEFFLISVASSIAIYSLLRLFFGYEISMIFGILLAMGLAAAKNFFPQLKNLAVVLATAGVGVTFGVSFSPIIVMLFLVIVSIYDYLAVFITKHMIDLATFVIKKDLAFTVTAKEIVEGKERRIDIGSGDFIMPIMFEVSVIPLGFNAVLSVFIGALVACAIFIYLAWQKKIILPAIPPLVLGMFIAFLASLLTGFI